MSRRTKIGGIDVEVVSELEAEESDCVVCMYAPSRYFDDDVLAKCAGCGRQIVHRPHVPKKPPKLCLPCANALFGQEAPH
jgi:hypothetical protein